jgi:hypothetical protein
MFAAGTYLGARIGAAWDSPPDSRNSSHVFACSYSHTSRYGSSIELSDQNPLVTRSPSSRDLPLRQLESPPLKTPRFRLI